MGYNTDKWARLNELIDSISGLNKYIFPADAGNMETPFVEIEFDQIRHVLSTGQGCSKFHGIFVNITIGVSTKRDNVNDQSDSIIELLNLFDTVQEKILLDADGSNAECRADVLNENVEVYKISYSGYFNQR